MLVLALDTATPRVGVALLDGERVCSSRCAVDARRHGELLAPAVAEVLAEAGVELRSLGVVAVGVGPGPFTGLRVGLVTARTLGAALGIPVHGVCTLDALALGAGLAGRFAVVTDARRREVYWALYDGEDAGPVRRSGPHVGPPDQVPTGVRAVGEGAALHPDAFPRVSGPLHPDPADIGRWLVQGRATLAPDPLYLRRADAAAPGARKRVLA